MKILQYIPGMPPVMVGGMIKYALDLAQEEKEAGHEIVLLVPGKFTHLHKETSKIVKRKWKSIDCYRIINSVPVSGGKGMQNVSALRMRGDKALFIKFLFKENPSIIHVHSFMGLPIAFFEAAAELRIPIVYTTHDYYGICPKAILLNDMEQCMTTDGSQCPYCIDGVMTIKKIKWQQSPIYGMLKKNPIINFLEYSQKLVPIKIYIRSMHKKYEKQRHRSESILAKIQEEQEYLEIQRYYKEMFGYVTRFHYNSIQAKEIFTQYMGNISGEVISISNKNISDRRKKRALGKKLRIGFIGRGAYKGFDLLKETLQSLFEEGLQDFECHVYFNPKEKLPPYIISHKPYKEDEMDRIYDGIDILVLPSVWKETYGLVVLEALSYGIPVIVSQSVGAKELLAGCNGMGVIVKPTKEALYEALKNVYCNRDLLERMNLKICNCDLRLNYEEHVHDMINMYEKTIILKK
ncbi:hypothetical protein C804_06037 [Lachnospiraceae bacterium A4]|nr:hypothetical protein C804_06037 [Lachnospiraceae bacterium A4]